MLKIMAAVILSILSALPAHTISKEEYLKLSYDKRRDFAPVAGAASEYAIPREEFLKLPFEVRRTIGFEIARGRVLYASENVGKRESDLDVSRLYNLSMIDGERYKDAIIDYGTICDIYVASCENHFKAAGYCYKEYLEWKKYEQGQPSLWEHPGGDAHPLSRILALYEEYDMYKDWDALYTDYNEFWWKRYAASECKQLTSPGPDCVGNWLKNSGGYQSFLKEWKEVKRKAKTVAPKPLSVQVRVYEDFYSGNVKKVSGAVEYYRKNDVKFMVEKSAKHKNPVVAKKAKEYLDNWDKPAPEEKKEAQPAEGKK